MCMCRSRNQLSVPEVDVEEATVVEAAMIPASTMLEDSADELTSLSIKLNANNIKITFHFPRRSTILLIAKLLRIQGRSGNSQGKL